MVIVFDGVKGALQKESFVKSVYDALLTASSSPFRNTGQGVCFCGEIKLKRSRSESKKSVTRKSVGLRLKERAVTGTRPETF